MLTNGLEALGGTIEPTPRRGEPVATGSPLTSDPYLVTYKVVRNAGLVSTPASRIDWLSARQVDVMFFSTSMCSNSVVSRMPAFEAR